MKNICVFCGSRDGNDPAYAALAEYHVWRGNIVSADTIQGLADVCRDQGYHLMLADTDYSVTNEDALIDAYATVIGRESAS